MALGYGAHKDLHVVSVSANGREAFHGLPGIVEVHVLHRRQDCESIRALETHGRFEYAHARKRKQDFSSIAFTGQGPLDVTDLSPLEATIGPATGLVITGSNGAWGKSDNIKDITFTPVADTSFPGGVYEIEIEYKSRGFNPVPF